MVVLEAESRPPQAAPTPGARLWTRLGLCAGIALLLTIAHRCFVYTPDDAFITYRYARSLAEGYGPVFNPGAGDRVEGYSCPLFMILMAILMKLPLGLDILIQAKLLGIGCGIATLVVGQKFARRLNLPVWAQASLPLLLAAHAGISIQMLDGMETVLAALLTTLAAYHFVGCAPDPNADRRALMTGLLFAACALTRPEAVLMGLVSLGALAMARRRFDAAILRFALGFLLPVIVWFVFRRLYYGVWMPNTYYAKNAPLDLDVLTKGGTYLLRTFFWFLNESPFLMAIGGGWWLLAGIGTSSDRIRRVPGLALPLLVGVQMVFALRAGGDWMGGWRYMSAVAPLLMLLSVVGIVEIAESTAKSVVKGGRALAAGLSGALTTALLAACLLGQWSHWGRPEASQEGFLSWASKSYTRDQKDLLRGWLLHKAVDISEWLNKNIPANATLAYSEMGVTPFLCPQLRFLDVDGLTDHGVATLPGAKHEQIGVRDDYISPHGVVGPYLRDVRKPDYILRGISIEKGGALPPHLPILDDRYVPEAVFPMHAHVPTQESYMMVWKRRP